MFRNLFLLILLAAMVGCTIPPNGVPADKGEQGLAIAEVFEGQAPYSVRTLDTADIARFLHAFPEHRQDSASIAGFYHRREMQFAWVINDSLSASADAFIALAAMTDTLVAPATRLNRWLLQIYEEGLYEGRRKVLCDSCATALELRLTAAFFQFADRKYGGYLGHDLRELNWFIPRKKKDASQLLDSLVMGSMDLSAYEPIHPQYQALKLNLPRYHELMQAPWPALELPEGKRKLELGDSAAVIPLIRERLFLLGDLAERTSGTRHDSTLLAGMQRFQERHGLMPDGVIGPGSLKALNVPVKDRLRTMLVNMERLRWVPERNSPDLLLVNIPEFKLHVYEEGREVMNMEVVVGTAATRTVVFSDTLSLIVFSPTWTVPMSITRDEILPAMRKDPNYLRKKNMEIIGGSASNPIIRQKPGSSNSLGLVKFLFPNSYSIYMHDTPSKGLFAREQRAFSHGCIRLSKPRELAEYLLRNEPEWTPERIAKAMKSGKETTVRLKERRPVTIGYFTAWVDAEGRLNFRDDIYGHDARLASELFQGDPAGL